jgi:hypothetical protein
MRAPAGFDPRPFVESAPWRFAKTMAHMPHEYLVEVRAANVPCSTPSAGPSMLTCVSADGGWGDLGGGDIGGGGGDPGGGW